MEPLLLAVGLLVAQADVLAPLLPEGATLEALGEGQEDALLLCRAEAVTPKETEALPEGEPPVPQALAVLGALAEGVEESLGDPVPRKLGVAEAVKLGELLLQAVALNVPLAEGEPLPRVVVEGEAVTAPTVRD